MIGKRTPAAIAHSELKTRIAISVPVAKENTEVFLLIPSLGNPCNWRFNIFLASSLTSAMLLTLICDMGTEER